MHSLLLALGRMLIWTPGTFFCFPWKPVVSYACGASYQRAFSHFRRDHADPTNLLIHLLCLVIQICGNFGLLAVLDSKTGFATGWLAWLTACLWIATFCVVPAPATVRVITCMATLGGFATRHALATHWRLLVPFMVAMQGPCAWYAAKAPYQLRGGVPLAFASAVGALSAGAYALALPPPGVLSAHAAQCNAAFLLLCAALSQVRVQNEPLCETVCGALGWAVAVATDDPTMLLLTASYVGGSLQGVAHEYTGEKATLGQLSSLTDEMAHTTYFPALLVHACCEYDCDYGPLAWRRRRAAKAEKAK
jgi:hypothetical protein